MSLADDILDEDEQTAGWLAPGSPEAVTAGCRCPTMDNAHGRGAFGSEAFDGGPYWWFSEDCPLHCGPKDEQP